MLKEHFAFSDEKGSGQERYWGICVASGPTSSLHEIKDNLKHALGQCRYIEWKDVDGDSRRQDAAKGYIEAAIAAACRKTLRIDVLLWDMQDSRHAVPGRDNIQNLERMYYRILTHCGRICNVSRWRIYPDNNSALNWDNIANYFQRTKVARLRPHLISLFEENSQNFDMVDLKPQESKQEPLVQLADLFVGMGCFSIEKKDKLQNWIESQQHKAQQRLFPMHNDIYDKESRAELARKFVKNSTYFEE